MKKLLLMVCGVLVMASTNTAFAGWWGSPRECYWAHQYGRSCWHPGPPPVSYGYVPAPAKYAYTPPAWNRPYRYRAPAPFSCGWGYAPGPQGYWCFRQ